MMRTRPLWLLFVVIVVSADSVQKLAKDEIEENWRKFEGKIKGQVDDVLRQLLPVVLRRSAEANITAPCQGAIVRMTFAVRQLRGWALKMLDAWGKPPAGLLEGTLSALGSYPECLGTVAYQDEDKLEGKMFRGQYCTLLIRPPAFLTPASSKEAPMPRNQDQAMYNVVKAARSGQVLSLELAQYAYLSRDNAMRFAVCTPSVCSKDDIQNIAQLAVKDFEVAVTVSSCEIQEPTKIQRYQIIALCAIGGFLLLSLLGTSVDVLSQVLCPPKKHQPQDCAGKVTGFVSRALCCFSLPQNVRSFLDTSKKGSLGCLNGVRVISMIGIIHGHTYFLIRNSQIYRSLLNGYDSVVNNIFFTPVINITFGVESFFFISGVLVVYSNWPKLEKSGGKMNLFTYLLHRFSRLSPSLAITTILMVLLPLWGSGPFWKETIDFEVENCVDRGWMNMIFINNFIHYKRMCMPTTWYLATNMQFYVLSIIFIVPIFRFPRLGLTIVGVLALLGIGATAAITWIYDLAPGMIFTPNFDVLDEVVVKIYHKPWAHVGGFCVGAVVGYLLRAKKTYNIKPALQCLGWVCCLVLVGTLAYGTFEWNKGRLPPTWLAAFFAATHRTAWTIGVGWLVYMCATNRGGLLNTVLSWGGFVPLANISYLCYLLHPLVILYNFGTAKERIYFDHYNMGYLFFGHLTVTVILATLCYLLVELPFAKLDTVLFASKGSPAPTGSSSSGGASSGGQGLASPEYLAQQRRNLEKSFVARL